MAESTGDVLNVSVADGKYTVKMSQAGRLHALRYGEPWRDCVGDNLIYYLAVELQETRGQRDRALELVQAALTDDMVKGDFRYQLELILEALEGQ